MNSNNKIFICGEEYLVCDVLSGNIIEDCSVCKEHKIGSGHGERKIYLQGNVKEKFKFFDDFEMDIQGFLLKSDLEMYLLAAKKEFKNPTQNYKQKEYLKIEYKKLLSKVVNLEDVISFSVKKVDVTHSGLYIKSLYFSISSASLSARIFFTLV